MVYGLFLTLILPAKPTSVLKSTRSSVNLSCFSLCFVFIIPLRICRVFLCQIIKILYKLLFCSVIFYLVRVLTEKPFIYKLCRTMSPLGCA